MEIHVSTHGKTVLETAKSMKVPRAMMGIIVKMKSGNNMILPRAGPSAKLSVWAKTQWPLQRSISAEMAENSMKCCSSSNHTLRTILEWLQER